MVRNEDDLELAKRFDLVSGCFTIHHWHQYIV
jgi:hypothetical protein